MAANSVPPKNIRSSRRPPPPSGGTEADLIAALANADADPSNLSHWDVLDALAGALQKPDEVSSLYRKVLASDLTGTVAAQIGERAVKFHEEWFGEAAPAFAEVLSRVFQRDPKLEWILGRLTVAYTRSERWNDLLAAYDLAIDAAPTQSRRTELLDEALNVARDFARDNGRAISYLERLRTIRPNDAKTAQSLERLLEREERHGDLIKLWQSRVAAVSPEDGAAIRVRIATTEIDQRHDPAAALEELRAILATGTPHPEVPKLLERIASEDHSSRSARAQALDILRDMYGPSGRKQDLARLLKAALTYEKDTDARRQMLKELGMLASEAGNAEEAFELTAVLLVQDPSDTETRDQLRTLAERTGAHGRYAEVLTEAGEKASEDVERARLLSLAAGVYRDQLNDRGKAIDLLTLATKVQSSDRVITRAVRELARLLESEGRTRDRVAVLEQLGVLESDPTERRAIVSEAARAWEQLGETQRAVDTWRSRVAADATDVEALNAIAALFERDNRYAELVETLEARARVESRGQIARREDLVRIARLEETELENPARAIQVWRLLQTEFGEDAQSNDALATLFDKSSAYGELAQLLGRATEKEGERAADVYCRLGDVLREHLEDIKGAAAAYAEGLAIRPTHPGAERGALAIANHDDRAKHAPGREKSVVALARAYEAREAWPEWLALLDARLELAGSDVRRVQLLDEAARVCSDRLNDAGRAADLACRAMLLDPHNVVVQTNAHPLARGAGRVIQWAKSVRDARAQIERSSARYWDLTQAEGECHERELSDPASALACYVELHEIEPGRIATVAAVIRTALAIENYDRVVDAFVECVKARDVVDGGLLELVQQAPTAVHDGILRAIEADRLGQALSRIIARTLAVTFRSADDAGRETAALRLAWRAGDHSEACLERLVDLLRPQDATDLPARLADLGELRTRDLDAWLEAIQLYAERGASEQRATLLEKTLERGRGLAERREESSGQIRLQAGLVRAAEELAGHYEGAARERDAVSILGGVARLVHDSTQRAAFRTHAAELASQNGDLRAGIELLREVVHEDPAAPGAVDALAQLYERTDRIGDLLELRRRELETIPAGDRRLALRLDVARLAGVVEERGGRVQLLLDNLGEHPGHVPTVQSLALVLRDKGRSTDLVEVLEREGAKLERTDPRRSAEVLAEAAHTAEFDVRDIDRAIGLHRRVVALSPLPASLDALARIYAARGDHARAVEFLERRYGTAAASEKSTLALDLSRAYVQANREERAVARLEALLVDEPQHPEAEEMLVDLYRRREEWSSLARLLTDIASREEDGDKLLRDVREAADIFARKLGTPDRAIHVLQRAVELAPTDRDLRLMLADGLRVAGRLEEARAILEALVTEFGRRRSPERALVQFRLGQLERAAGNFSAALEQLELASGMDANSTEMLRLLADTAREAGELERAERAYRALLLVVRRQQADVNVTVGVSEVLFELHSVAKARGQEDQAHELLESAVAASTENPTESARFKRLLQTRGERALLVRLLTARVEAAENPSDRADVLADLADVYENAMEKPDAALDARLRAVSLAPQALGNQDATARLAARLGQTERYVSTLERQVDKLRRREESALAAVLTLRIGRVVEMDLKRPADARAIYSKVEQSGFETANARFALADVAAALGDRDEQVRVLHDLLDDSDERVQIDAMFRLGELALRSEADRSEGVAHLREAVERNGDWERAAKILRPLPDSVFFDPDVLSMYERAARATRDPATLLDFMLRRAESPNATIEEVKEAVDFATTTEASGATDKVDGLLRRALVISEEMGNPGRGVWAALALADRLEATNDVRGAGELLAATISRVPDEDVRVLADRLVRLADSEGGDKALAFAAAWRLFEMDRGESSQWENVYALALVHASVAQLAEFMRNVLERSDTTAERNKWRVRYAEHLIKNEGARREITAVLREALDDDSSDKRASEMLTSVLERDGETDALVEELQRQVDSARDRSDPAALIDGVLRMGAQYEKVAHRRDEALDVYRSGLESAEALGEPASPANVRLIDAALRALDYSKLEEADRSGVRAELLEKKLAAGGMPNPVAACIEIAELYQANGNEDGATRALETGHRLSNGDEALRTRLAAWYEIIDAPDRLAELYATDAERELDPERSAKLFRSAAAVQRDRFGNLEAASSLLAKALERAPRNMQYLEELIASRRSAGDLVAAAQDVATALVHAHDEKDRVKLLLMKADIRADGGDTAGALEDFEGAYAIAGEGVSEQILSAYARAANDESDATRKRDLVIRYSDLCIVHDRREDGRAALAVFVNDVSEDPEVLGKLLTIDQEDGRYQEVAEGAMRLARSSTGDPQIRAALLVHHAFRNLGEPFGARNVLEDVHTQTRDAEVRAALKEIYESSGEALLLSGLLIVDAEVTDEPAAKYTYLRRAGEILVNDVRDPASAIAPLQSAFEIKPDDHSTTVLLSDAMMESGQLAEASDVLQKSIATFGRRRSPDLAMLQHRMARLSALAEARDTQLEWLKVAHDTDKNNSEVASELVDVSMSMTDYDTALKALRALTMMKDPAPMTRGLVFLRQAQISHIKGDPRRAVLWARKAKEEDPNLDEATNFLSELGES